MKLNKRIQILLINNKLYIKNIVNQKYIYALDNNQVVNIVNNTAMNDLLLDSKDYIDDDTLVLEYEMQQLYKKCSGKCDNSITHIQAYIFKLIPNESTIDFDAINALLSMDGNINDLQSIDKEVLQNFNIISYALITIVYDELDKTGDGAITYTDFIGEKDYLSINYQEADKIFDKICKNQMLDM